MSVIGGRQVTGGKGRESFRPSRLDILWVSEGAPLSGRKFGNKLVSQKKDGGLLNIHFFFLIKSANAGSSSSRIWIILFGEAFSFCSTISVFSRNVRSSRKTLISARALIHRRTCFPLIFTTMTFMSFPIITFSFSFKLRINMLCIPISRDYAATLAAPVQKWFLGPLGPGKIPQISVLEAESFRRRHDSTSFHDKIHFP
jgi:hypothetical protein